MYLVNLPPETHSCSYVGQLSQRWLRILLVLELYCSPPVKNYWPLLLLTLLSYSSFSSVLAAPRRDFAGQYRAERRVGLDTRREGDSLRLYLRFPDGNMLRQGYPLHVAAWADYDAKRPLWQDTVRHLARRIRTDGSAAWVEFCLPLSRLRAGQLLSINASTAAEADAGDAAWLALKPDYLSRSFVLTDSVGQPLLRRFVQAYEPFGVDSYGPDLAVQTRLYPLSSQPALPPMSNPAAVGPQPRTLGLQDSTWFRAGQLLRLPAGLYLLRTEQQKPWCGLLVEENNFPDLTSADELIAPLTFLTSSAERKKLFDAPDPKKAVDAFWLNLVKGDQPTARLLIRTYYGRVMDANRLFSSHKAGWLTDRGLLYIVMGPPETVYRTGGEERWVYRGTPERAGTYTFRPKPSTFAPENYELVRRPEYERLWYAAVEQWRKGIIARPGR